MRLDTNTFYAMQDSSFTPCPVCKRSIAKTSLDFHLNSCLSATRDAAPSLPSRWPAHMGALQEATGQLHASQMSAETAQLPFVNSQEAETIAGPAKLSNAGNLAAAAAAASSPGKQTVPVMQEPNPAQDAAKPPQPCTHNSPQPGPRPRGNAFAHMMAKQREQSQSWTFFLGRHLDGSLHWRISKDGPSKKQNAPDAGIFCHGSLRYFMITSSRTQGSKCTGVRSHTGSEKHCLGS